MTTLSSIGFTLGGGLGVFSFTLVWFSAAVIKRNIFVAGRCVARPRDVIYNPDPSHPCQDRGKTPWGWFTWAMSLSYDTLLSGVPGTGTRDGGLTGHLLKINLDGIVIMRYHFLGLKVSFMATLLYLSVIMPMYSTARCSFLQGDEDTPECTNSTLALTDYEQLTLKNIRELEPYEDPDNLFMSFFDVLSRQNMGRLYSVAVCTWIVTWYMMHLLHREWLDILAMRRVYYLEADHYKDRVEELGNVSEEQNRKDAARIEKRAVYVPHPELRDTVPNIELYSILVGGLPSLPTDAVEDAEAVFSKKQSMDWQLSVTTAFFDHCVPNQPGFSSSVAAVTILPAANQITDAWSQWYKAAAKVRQLRFIRERIKFLKENEGNDTKASSEVVSGKDAPEKRRRMRRRGSIHHDEVLGSETDLEVEDHIFHALNLGPEQTAVYGREFALGAAGFAPHGWFEWRITNAGLKELLVMEDKAARAVQQASSELQEARDRIAVESSDEEDSEIMSLNTTDFEDIGPDSQCVTPPPQSDLELDDGVITPPRSPSGRSPVYKGSDNMLPGVFAPSLSEDVPTVSTSVRSKRSVASSSPSDKDNSTRPSTRLRKPGRRLSGSGHSNRSDSLDTFSPKSSVKSSRSTKLSRASMAQLPTALGLEAGLWTEQSKLSRGSAQSIPRSNKARGGRQRESSARSAPPRRVMSVDIAGMIQTTEIHNDTARTRSRTPNRSIQSDRPLTTRKLFDDDNLRPSSGVQKALLKKATTTGTLDALSTRLSSVLERSDEAAVKENAKDLSDSLSSRERSSSVGSDRKKKVDRTPSVGSDSSGEWKRLEEEWRKSLRARVSKKTKTTESSNAVESVTCTTNRTNVSTVPQQMNGAEGNSPSSPVMQSRANNDKRDKQQDITASFLEEGANNGIEEVEENLEIAYNFEQRAGLRKRENGASYSQHGMGKHTEKWGKVMSIVEETAKDMNGGKARKRIIANGRWTVPSFRAIFGAIKDRIKSIFSLSSPEVLGDFASDATYAVVTFTSRQAAVAARHCLADARGADRWVNRHDLPIPPLADAPTVCSTSCQGLGRPVTLSISDAQKKIRKFVAYVCLGIIYFFYTIPLTAVQNSVSEDELTKLYPEISEAKKANPIMANILLGLIPALIWILFFAICPPLFKIIANFGSTATTTVKAENSALRYFWYFMILTAFTGDSVQRAVIEGFRDGIKIGAELQKLVEETAERIPARVSSNWLNWIIARMFVVLPTQYLLQMNTFLFTWLRCFCLQRAVSGGGAGPPIPYRIYVDSGVVLLCLFAIAPASPLVAPAACLYFLLALPLLRWTHIFLYKPKFDVGGGRFPFIFDVCVSGMLVGQILLFTMMLLKKATGPAIAAITPFLPTIFFRFRLRTKYLGAFADAALLQTSLLDGWDNEDDATDEEREEFRKFLVDCHKAAYVPVCIASGDARTLITAEPAVVIPMDDDPVDEELIGQNVSQDSTDILQPFASPKPQLPTYKTTTVGARVSLTPRSAKRTTVRRRSKLEGNLPSLPFQQSHALENSNAPDSPGSKFTPANVMETQPSSTVSGRRTSLPLSKMSAASLRRASLESSEKSGGSRASFTTMKLLQSPSPSARRLLVSPSVQHSSQRGMMMRRMSRQSTRMSIANPLLPPTAELPFGDDD